MKHFAALAVTLSFAACAPLSLQDAPHMYGRIVSAASGAPVPGASLYYENQPEQVIRSGSDGRFEFPTVHGLHFVPLFGSNHSDLAALVVEAPGYLRTIKGIPVNAQEPYYTVISLSPAPPPPQ